MTQTNPDSITLTTTTSTGNPMVPVIRPAPTAPGQPAGTWTAEQNAAIQAIAAREKDQGHRAGETAARAALAEKLGVELADLDQTLDSAKAAREAVTAAETAAMSEAERLKSDAAKEHAKAQTATATATAVLRETLVQAACVRAGAVDAEVLKDLVRLVSVDADPTDRAAFDTAAEEAVAAYKTRYPTMFAQTGPVGATSSTPVGASRPPASPPAPGDLTRGAQRAQAERAAGITAPNPVPPPQRGGNPFA